ncbi:MAG: hypothetical protein RMK89_02300 [Armatimonadota bacterium]|nr:hypothetical protein [Armatimonadota bacterium]MDW8142273.1 hypothetical protein [Armatimonadota bacterium]
MSRGIGRKWRMAPGENAKWWDECRSNGCILIGWEEVAEEMAKRGSDLKAVNTKSDMKGLFAEVYGKKGRGAGGWSQVWKFVHEMKPGDIVVAKTGRHQILGIGIVTSDYIPPNSPEHPLKGNHEWRGARKVDWRIITDEPISVNLNLGAVTLVEEGMWDEIVKACKEKGIDVHERLWGQNGSTLQRGESELSGYFTARGFRFASEQIATFYAALKVKGFVILSGLSGTGKTKLAELFADLLCPNCRAAPKAKRDQNECTHLFLSVRPDWRDGKPLLGYYNPLTERYESTPLLRLLLRARADYEQNRENAYPYFVILDEMNLSHVEYYFADFLSVLESGRDEKGWTKEPLRLHSFKQVVRDRDDQEIPPELHLPPNLYFVGTVNIDETTYMFSPKVLDRAFTIEFRDVSFGDYPTSESGDDKEIAEQIGEALLRDLRNGGKFCAVATNKQDIRQALNALGKHKEELEKLNQVLQPYDLHFGYRVLDEIALFVQYAKSLPEVVGKPLSDDEALDYAVLVKVLPKFHGPRQKLEKPLWHVMNWCLKNPISDLKPNELVQKVWEQLSDSSDQKQLSGESVAEVLSRWNDSKTKFRHPATARKALQMLRQLYETGFASFAQ